MAKLKTHKRAYRPAADNWDGPFFRPFQCGYHLDEKVLTPHMFFMNAIEPVGSWRITLDGYAVYKVANERHLLRKGHVLAARYPSQGELAYEQGGLPWRYLWIQVSGKPALEMFDYIVRRYGALSTLPLDCKAVQAAKSLLYAAQEQPHRTAHFWSQKTFEFLNAWWQQLAVASPPLSGALKMPPRDSKLLSFTPRTVKNYAAELGYSRSYLTRKLRRYWRQPPGKLLRKARLDEAARLLRTTDLSVSDVAEKVGYSTHNALSRAFRQAFETSPLQYRHASR